MPRVRNVRPAGMVFAMTNAVDRNAVVAFRRRLDGTIRRVGAFATGGTGTGPNNVSPATPQTGVDPLASQGSLRLSRSRRWLFAVNAGSNSISSLRVHGCGRLRLADVEPSGGLQPNSLAIYGSLLYVANVGSAANNYSSNITGFRIWRSGRLVPIVDATYSLSSPTAQPASLVFSPCGRWLVVTELTTNQISVFRVNSDGRLSGPTVNQSAGAGPFGAAFLHSGLLLVAEAGANALSSYSLAPDGILTARSASVPSDGIASCWVAVSSCQRYAFVSNTGSGTIASYQIQRDGTLVMLRLARTTPGSETGAPIDSGVSTGGSSFYVLDGSHGWITAFHISRDGRLIGLQVLQRTGLPELGSQGLAVR